MRSLQAEIMEFLKVQPIIDPQEEIERSIQLMMDYLSYHSGLTSLVLGISGGQDSTLVGKLAQMAIDRLRQAHPTINYRFIAVRLPYGDQLDRADAQAALDYIQADQVITVNIKSSTDKAVQSLQEAGQEISDFNKGNIKARIRMIIQYAIAGQNQGVVLGTDHAAESVTGFFTKYGDGAADLMPIWRLTKSQGRQLLAYLECPSALYKKIPTADLEDQRPMQSDEEALGVSYDEIDQYLMGQAVSESAARVIENWYLKTKHKRHLPITVFDDFWK